MTKPARTDRSESAADNEPLVRRYFDGCESGDVDEIRATLAANVTHYFLANDRPPIHGDEHLARFWAKMKRVLDTHWSVDRALAVRNEVVVEWSLFWTHPETGGRRVTRGTEWHVVSYGEISEIRAYFNFPVTPPLIDYESELVGFPYAER
jgi:ketosteroid isomerase-like protein